MRKELVRGVEVSGWSGYYAFPAVISREVPRRENWWDSLQESLEKHLTSLHESDKIEGCLRMASELFENRS